MDAVLTLTDAPTAEQQRVIGSGFVKFNAERAGYSDSRDLAILVSDPATQQVVGGLLGRTSLGILFVDLFYVPDALRGQRLGAGSWWPRRTKRCAGAAPRPCCTRSASRRQASTNGMATARSERSLVILRAPAASS
jgi:hypothetical protein